MYIARRNRSRRTSGQALIEGAVVMAISIPVFVGLLLFLLNVGMSMYYKERIAFIAHQIAEYTATIVSDYGTACNPTIDSVLAQRSATTVLNNMLHNMGLPAQATVTATVDHFQTVSINVHLYNLPLIAGGYSYIPLHMNLEETASAPLLPFKHQCGTPITWIPTNLLGPVNQSVAATTPGTNVR